MRICVFCSSSPDLPDVYVRTARELGAEMARRGHTLVFGGFDQGTMGDVARGCADAGGKVLGVLSSQLASSGREVFPCAEVMTEPDLAHRKARMSQLADAFVTLPGGLGTFDEFFGVIAQMKAGELSGRIAIVNVAGYFDPLVEMLDKSCATGLNSTDWHAYGDVFATPAEALDYLES